MILERRFCREAQELRIRQARISKLRQRGMYIRYREGYGWDFVDVLIRDGKVAISMERSRGNWT